jgi:hypothetical protein
MTQVRLIGDVHGKFKRYREIIRGVPFSIQVGDMGVGFRKIKDGEVTWSNNPPYEAMNEGDHRYIRGNHDNPEVCLRQSHWIPDGSLVEGMFCVGGAVSVDKQWRTEGLDWWADEECSYEKLNEIIDDYAKIKPDVVISHDCPESIALQILAVFNRKKIEDGSRTRQALEQMLYIHQPREWYFGHWHIPLQFKSGNTLFRCLDELEYADIEV